jgi:hypothetical protein
MPQKGFRRQRGFRSLPVTLRFLGRGRLASTVLRTQRPLRYGSSRSACLRPEEIQARRKTA